MLHRPQMPGTRPGRGGQDHGRRQAGSGTGAGDRDPGIMEGVKLEVEPERVIVIREYPSYVLLDMEFVKSFFCPGLPPRHSKIGIPKGSMLCGDVKLKRLSDGVLLCGKEVGHFEWI